LNLNVIDKEKSQQFLGLWIATFLRPLMLALVGGCGTWIASFFFGGVFAQFAWLFGFDLVAFGFFSFGACLGFLSSFVKPLTVNVRNI